ncbi:hypothetical protein NPIL_559811 [Nephila pilipes]|uniref:RNA-directed DNA polymerase from mobile element jockey n=1 Tax=Nephila pilipes TaxID=299642 RepID=A0A8X6IPY7_NEPPI|nr:hypothetical protein NPIL_559811 [Nephila pilipes]
MKRHHFPVHLPEQPTRITHRANNSIIDICLAKGLHFVTSKSITALASDHNPVLFTVDIDDINSPALNTIRFTNWTTFQQLLIELLLKNPKIATKQEIDETLENFTTQYSKVINSSSKLKIIYKQPSLRKQIQFKNIVRKRWQETRPTKQHSIN